MRGHKKRRKEDDIHPEEHEHSPTVSRRTQNPAGFYSGDNWDESKQEDEWQMPDKWQRISQMVFCGGCLEINLEDIFYYYSIIEEVNPDYRRLLNLQRVSYHYSLDHIQNLF